MGQESPEFGGILRRDCAEIRNAIDNWDRKECTQRQNDRGPNVRLHAWNDRFYHLTDFFASNHLEIKLVRPLVTLLIKSKKSGVWNSTPVCLVGKQTTAHKQTLSRIVMLAS